VADRQSALAITLMEIAHKDIFKRTAETNSQVMALKEGTGSVSCSQIVH
jgi:hypothetical protein